MPFKSKYRRRPNKSLKKTIKNVVNSMSETKTIVSNYASTSIQDQARAPINTDILSCATGDTQSTRTGNAITVTGLYGDFFFNAADVTNSIRVLLYVPHNPTDDMAIQFNQAPDLDRFTVLRDMLVTVSTQGPAVVRRKIKVSFKKGNRKGLTCRWHDTTATGFSKNPIRLYMVSDSTAVTDPSVSGYIRAYYKDL